MFSSVSQIWYRLTEENGIAWLRIAAIRLDGPVVPRIAKRRVKALIRSKDLR